MKQSIYISYAWGDSPCSEEEIALKGLCKAFKDNGFEVIHDRTHLDYHKSLPAFFKTIGEGGIVIPIVGKKYFTRLNCLIEATNLIIRGDIKERIFPLVLSDNYDIYDTLKRPKILSEIETIWKEKEDELKKAIIYSNDLPGSYILIRQNLNVISQVIAAITPFINHIGTNKQFNFDEEVKNNFETFIKFIINKTTEEIKKPFYQKIEGEYFGREDDIKLLDDFLRDEKKHFLLLLGVGGMGKSHLLSVCLDKFNYKQKFLWIRADENFELRNLFEKCNLRFPKELEDSKKICKNFLDEFTSNDLFLIIDDFYEIIDINIREMLKELACLPSGKLLIISRAIPKEIESQKVYHHQISPLGKDDFTKAMKAYITTEGKRKFSDTELNKIFDKAQGYPLGGQLVIRLADINIDIPLDDILNEIPRFEAEIDAEGKRFSERILDNIFQKSKSDEINLLCEFSALFGFPSMEDVRHLPSFRLDSFISLINRRKFITRLETGNHSAHAMIRDYAYEKLIDKGTIHNTIGRYFEEKLTEQKEIDWAIAESAILHFKKVSKSELELFGQRMFIQFRNRHVKSIIEQSLENTIRNYKNLIEVYPDYILYYNELGMAYRKNKQLDKAIETLKKATEIEPDNVRILNELGISYRENKQPDKAIETLKKAIEIEPDNVRILNELGISYRENKQLDKAIETLKKATEIEPDNVRILNELGISYRENKQLDKAIETLKKAIKIEPHALPSLNELGISYRENKQLDKAIETLKKAIKIEPHALPSLNELGISYRENKQLDKAIETWEKIIEIEPNDLASINELGITYREDNHFDKAIETFKKIVEIKPHDLASLNQLGITYRENNQPDKAIETLNKAIEIEPKDFRSLNELGITYRVNNQFNKAIETWKKIVGIKPNDYISLYLIGITYRENKQLDKAIETLNKAIEIEPKDFRSLNALRIIYRENKQLDKLNETLKKMIEINPKDLATVNELGITYRENKQLDKAIETFKKAIEIEPENVLVLTEFGKTLCFNNSYQEAISILENAIKIDPHNIQSYSILYKAYIHERNFSESINIVKRALIAKPNDKKFLEIKHGLIKKKFWIE